MSILTKEFRLLYGNKVFLLCFLFFTLIYSAIGYGARYVYEEVVNDLNVVYYFIFVYSMSLTLLMLQVYPASNDIREQAYGGVENILATGYPLSKLILHKMLPIFSALYLPSSIMVVIIIIWSKLYLAGLVALLCILPVINAGLSLIYTCTVLLSPIPGMVMNQISFYAVAGIFLLSYGPVLIYRTTGYVVGIKVSILLSFVFSLLVGFRAYRKFKKNR